MANLSHSALCLLAGHNGIVKLKKIDEISLRVRKKQEKLNPQETPSQELSEPHRKGQAFLTLCHFLNHYSNNIKSN